MRKIGVKFNGPLAKDVEYPPVENLMKLSETGSNRKCFGHYLNLPKCRVCPVELTCLRATLGGMAERGLLRERFDPVRGELVYSLSEKGRRREKLLRKAHV